MIKLVRLEWKKNNVIMYIRNAVIATAILAVFMLMMLKAERIICRN